MSEVKIDAPGCTIEVLNEKMTEEKLQSIVHRALEQEGLEDIESMVMPIINELDQYEEGDGTEITVTEDGYDDTEFLVAYV